MLLSFAMCPRTPGRQENTSMSDDLENLLRPSYSIWGNGCISSYFLRRTRQDSINPARKCYLEYFSDVHYVREGMWKGDILVADIEELENSDASEIHARRLNAKGTTTPKTGEHFYNSRSRLEQQKLFGRNQRVRESTLRREQLVRE